MMSSGELVHSSLSLKVSMCYASDNPSRYLDTVTSYCICLLTSWIAVTPYIEQQQQQQQQQP